MNRLKLTFYILLGLLGNQVMGQPMTQSELAWGNLFTSAGGVTNPPSGTNYPFGPPYPADFWTPWPGTSTPSLEDASGNSVTNNGGFIYTWKDSIDGFLHQGYDLTNEDYAFGTNYQPTLNTNMFSVVHGSGLLAWGVYMPPFWDGMNGNDYSKWPVTNQPFTLLTVLYIYSLADNLIATPFINPPAGSGPLVWQAGFGGYGYAATNWNMGTRDFELNGPIPTTGAHVAVFCFNGTNSFIRIDGLQIASGTIETNADPMTLINGSAGETGIGLTALWTGPTATNDWANWESDCLYNLGL